MQRLIFLVALTLTASACSLTGTTRESVPLAAPWSAEFAPPTTLDTDRVHLEPLGPQHAELDHAAFMSSRSHLHNTLHWGDWPAADMTVEQNRGDLQGHIDQFEENEGYAFTVLTPEKDRCVGCVYMYPPETVDTTPNHMRMYYWVVESELDNDLDQHLLESLFAWFPRSWPYEEVSLPLHVDNARALAQARALGLVDGGRNGDLITMIWKRQ